MLHVNPAQWTPRGVSSLEPAAEATVRSQSNSLVVAGPGAGKTELLAQRACFLLETGLCAAPQRILAISFKRDAAENLAERVAKRCGDKARRFESLTLDAFGKSLVDRFRAALPEEWRPPQGYEVLLKLPSVSEIRDWFLSVVLPPSLDQPNFRGMKDSLLKLNYERCLFGSRIPYEEEGVKPHRRHYGLLLWQQALRVRPGEPSLSFPMLNRLAAYLLRQNVKLRAALRATYSFVFMDEFQDTTASQYDLVQAAFLSSSSVVTAVGDTKQRIMIWAGAMENAFECFETDFGATRHYLVRNYRSAPELVRVQHFIAQAIEVGTPPAEAVRRSDGLATCSVLEFATPEAEARYIAEVISREVASGVLRPRDYCVLARQQTSSMIALLQASLQLQGIRLRDESTLQELLAEPVVALILAILRLATRLRDPEAWEFLTKELAQLHGADPVSTDDASTGIAAQLLTWAKTAIASPELNIAQLPLAIIEQIGEPLLRTGYRQYRAGNFLKERATTLGKALTTPPTKGVAEAVNQLIGNDTIPAMTVHKSKGLEFHTVVFLGLEDSQLWNFAEQSAEEIRGFFVAFSRAIHRVVFTFSDLRDGKYGRKPQEKVAIKNLYSILHAAGVPTVDLRSA